MAPGGNVCWQNRSEETQAKTEGEGTLGIVDLASLSVHILLHSLIPGYTAFRTTVCMHVWVI